MAYEVILLCHLHMPLYFIGTFTEYPNIKKESEAFIPNLTLDVGLRLPVR